jgi:methyltransferase family protein
MRSKEWTRKLAGSPLAPVGAFPVRLRKIARYDAQVVSESVRWLWQSNEHTNFTFDLDPRNRRHLEWFLAEITGEQPSAIHDWLAELDGDNELVHQIKRAVAASPRGRLADTDVKFGRRLAWYALVRALKPGLTVESGIDKGLGSCVIASALLRNTEEGHPGRHIALDINPDAGYLIQGKYASVVDIIFGDSLTTIPTVPMGVGIFLHECMGTYQQEAAEYRLIAPKLAPNALLVTDNASKTDALVEYADSQGRRFLFFREVPHRHWWPGDGVGVAWKPRAP